MRTMSVVKPYTMTCDECDFTTRDQKLMDNHNCDIAQFGGSCEDYPACGHEFGDCNGLLYGSDEAIKEQVYREMDNEDNWNCGDDYCGIHDQTDCGDCLCYCNKHVGSGNCDECGFVNILHRCGNEDCETLGSCVC